MNRQTNRKLCTHSKTASMNTVKQIIKENKKEDWRNEWAKRKKNDTGWTILTHMTISKILTGMNKSPLRTKHIPEKDRSIVLKQIPL